MWWPFNKELKSFAFKSEKSNKMLYDNIRVCSALKAPTGAPCDHGAPLLVFSGQWIILINLDEMDEH